MQEIAVCYGVVAVIDPRHAARIVDSAAAGRDGTDVIAVCYGAIGVVPHHAAGIDIAAIATAGAGNSADVIAVFHGARVAPHHAAGIAGRQRITGDNRSGDTAAEGTIFHRAFVIACHAARIGRIHTVTRKRG